MEKINKSDPLRRFIVICARNLFQSVTVPPSVCSRCDKMRSLSALRNPLMSFVAVPVLLGLINTQYCQLQSL